MKPCKSFHKIKDGAFIIINNCSTLQETDHPWTVFDQMQSVMSPKERDQCGQGSLLL